MFDFKKLYLSFRYASDGVMFALRNNQNLRIHFLAAVVVVIAGVYFHVNWFEKAILGIMILLAICAEMINTSLEEMTNLITNEHRKEAKIAKDVGAGMVLVTSFGALIIGFLIFTPYVIRMFGN